MYIYNRTHAQHLPEASHDADGGAMKTTAIDLPPRPDLSSVSSFSTSAPSPRPPPSVSSNPHTTVVIHRPPPKDRRTPLPFSIPPLFFGPSNASSTSLVSSTAEGRPIPLDGSATAHRTSALRELNSNYPSPVLRHNYAKSTGAKSTTYSRPVIVRTYSGPSPAQQNYGKAQSHSGQYRPPSTSRPGTRRIPLFDPAAALPLFGPASAPKSAGAGVSSIGKHAPGGGLNMGRQRPKKKSAWQWISGSGKEPEGSQLPPIEAFSFRSFMAEMQESELESSLDKIAEICARSKYSLSNHYEGHVPPHGSGANFVRQPSGGRRRGNGQRREPGPTLQAVQSDDENNPNGARGHRKRRSGGRRRSVAYGTLETIMSSSRSSEEDKTKKKPAAEIAEEVRGRAHRKGSDSGSPSGSGSAVRDAIGDGQDVDGSESAEEARRMARKKSISFAHAVMDNTKHAIVQKDSTSPRGSAAALVGEPALPQTSGGQLEIRTLPATAYHENFEGNILSPSPAETAATSLPSYQLPHDDHSSNGGVLSNVSAWMQWRSPGSSGAHGGAASSHAEGSLRHLLNTVDGKTPRGKQAEYEA
jgi:hypothetical protein